MKSRPLAFLLLMIALFVRPLAAQEEPELFGFLEEGFYYSPGGHYRVEIPVLAELGGSVRDTPTIATFRDIYNTHIVIACVPLDEPLRAELTKLGRKDFLTWFFANHVQPMYAQAAPGASAESAKYLNSVQDGAVLVMSLLPGGTAFGDRVFLREEEKAPVAKRGSLAFLRNERIYVITTELAERSLNHRGYKTPVEEEDAVLRKRLLALVEKMDFPNTAAPAATPPATPAK